MILAAKACSTITQPHRDEIRAASALTFRRCTGYARIVEAVLYAAELLRKEAERA